jgi:uncharacterized membrane protein YebE (DUF533 family)
MNWWKSAIIATTIVSMLALPGCETTPAQEGAVIGGGLGAATGAIVGNQSGNAGEGALIGAGVGAITGALVGDHVRKKRERRYAAPSAAPAPQQTVRGHYETRIVRGANGETYEERVFVRDN